MTTSQEIVEKVDKREEKGKMIATSKTIYRIIGKDVFYVESQSRPGIFYYVMFNTEKNFEWCSCFDHSSRSLKCKHIHGVEYSIRKGTYKDTDKLPLEAKRDNQVCSVDILPYTEDEYEF